VAKASSQTWASASILLDLHLERKVVQALFDASIAVPPCFGSGSIAADAVAR
jgi:hypothetical protein